jgi:hypothetical protein
MDDHSRRFIAVLGATWVLFVAGAYLPDLGRGFVQDDFSWIAASRQALTGDTSIITPATPGFYRPLVGFSFSVDYLIHGLEARGYGFTNLLLYIACGAALARLCRQLHLSWCAALLAAFVWSLNPHGIGVALLWISGRTALWLTLFSLLAVVAFLKGQRALAAAFLFGALLSKEEAVALPVILLVWRYYLGRDGEFATENMPLDLITVTAPLLGYAALRMRTPAFTPATAPWFYKFTMDPAVLARNALEYLDRGATLALVMTLIACLVCGQRPALTPRDKRLLSAAAIWFCGGYALTLWLPVRSSLYAVFPSVASALACAVLVDATYGHSAGASARTVRLAFVLASMLLAIPIYRTRDMPWVEAARVSRRTMRTIAAARDALPTQGVIVLEDEPDTQSNFMNAFGTLGGDAVRLYTGRALDVRIATGSRLAADERLPHPQDVAARYRLVKGRIESQ